MTTTTINGPSLFDKLKSHLSYLRGLYVIQVSYVEGDPGKPPTLVEKNFLIHENEQTDYTKDVKNATYFSYIMGGLIIKKLIQDSADYPNLHFDLVPVNDAAFVQDVTGGPTADNASGEEEYQKGREIALARQKKAIADLKDVIMIPGVHGIGMIVDIDMQAKTEKEHINIGVSNATAKKQVLQFIERKNNANKTVPFIPGSYMGYKVIVEITPQSKPL